VLVDLGDGRLAELAAEWGERINVLVKTCSARPELAGLQVRPDGYVAWAAQTGADGLADALTRWFGVPERATMAV
jgi:hypothetical protein